MSVIAGPMDPVNLLEAAKAELAQREQEVEKLKLLIHHLGEAQSLVSQMQRSMAAARTVPVPEVKVGKPVFDPKRPINAQRFELICQVLRSLRRPATTTQLAQATGLSRQELERVLYGSHRGKFRKIMDSSGSGRTMWWILKD